MRLSILFFFLTGLLTSLSAQDSGWEISASFAPQLHKRVDPVNALLEFDPMDIPLSQRFRSIDTFTVDGIERIFIPTGNFDFIPTESNTWFGASIQVHRRLARGFEFSAGLFFNQASHSGQAKGPLRELSVVNRRGAVMYSVFETEVITRGGMVQACYHLFQEKKLHPYFGMGLTISHRTTDRTYRGQVYGGASVMVDDFPSLNAVSLSTSLTRFDVIAVGGLLYRLAPHWSVGVDFNTITGLGQGAFGLQLRHHI